MTQAPRSRPPPPPPRPESPEEEAVSAAARARVERFVVFTLIVAIAIFAWSRFRTPQRAPSPGEPPPAEVQPAPAK